ncbi:MAG: helix-turn-helix domain-containing protein, partial [Terriglobales bacterium]
GPGNDHLDGEGDAAFWNWYLPHSAESGDPMLEAGKASGSTSGLKSLVQSVKGEAERNAIANALDQARWNRKAAARLLKVSYRTLLYKIEQYHMSPPTSHLSGYGNGALRERSLYHKG